jgi:hypothetical protein
MHPFIWIAAALGGVAVWRRKHLKEDAEKVKTAAVDAKTTASAKIAAARGGSSAETTEDEAGDAVEAAGDAVGDANAGDNQDEASSN